VSVLPAEGCDRGGDMAKAHRAAQSLAQAPARNSMVRDGGNSVCAVGWRTGKEAIFWVDTFT
jgi:hypothetical protein